MEGESPTEAAARRKAEESIREYRKVLKTAEIANLSKKSLKEAHAQADQLVSKLHAAFRSHNQQY